MNPPAKSTDEHGRPTPSLLAPAAAMSVPAGLRYGFHVLVVALVAFLLVLATDTPAFVAGLAFGGWYLGGVAITGRGSSGLNRPQQHGQLGNERQSRASGHLDGRSIRSWPAAWMWLAALVGLWIVLMWRLPESGYLAFILFFIFMYLLPGHWSIPAVLAATATAVISFGGHQGWTPAVIVGPVIGALVALMIGFGYATLSRQSRARERLLGELVRTQEALARTERDAGIAQERARLARELHDTVAQGLASIQMLLHAAERSQPSDGAEDGADGTGGGSDEAGSDAGTKYVRLARETAAVNLTETRRFIKDLAPPALADEGLGPALIRLAGRYHDGPRVLVEAEDLPDLPMTTQTALFRITQGTLANAVQHATAQEVSIRVWVTDEDVTLEVVDDGIGFDPESVTRRAGSLHGASGADSFGLRAAQERVEQLGGTFTLTSRPGSGTTVQAVIGRGE